MSQSTLLAADPIPELVRCLGQQLLARGQRLMVAESCTGGALAKVLTDQAGSSGWFDSGVVTYSNAAKQRLLQVPAALLAEHGAVSEPVAAAMVAGLVSGYGADLGVSITGIAGPGGGSDAKPVGTVWFGWAVAGAENMTEKHVFAGDRAAVREQAVVVALQGLLHLMH